ncbi:MAG: YceI family protein [Alphaproteobacteria bacterium]|nr:YceI family protein [Alphaproteobacteria bacterium]
MKKFLCAAALVFSLIAAPALAADYVVDYKNSKIGFSGTHAGNAFSGTFGTWTALIRFDPADLAGSQIIATLDTNTAKTGSSMYDGTLPQADWLDVKNHPQATFTSSAITAKEDGSGYTAAGELTLRGVTKPVSFDFTLGDLAQTPVAAKASFAIDRLDFDIGKKSDAAAEWVSREIVLTLDISATPRAE